MIKKSSIITNNYPEKIKRIRFEIEEKCIECGRNPRDVAIMAVSKTRHYLEVNDVMSSGIDLVGENRAQELIARVHDYTFPKDKLHFIGSLQTNKVKSILPFVSVIQSLDSVRLAAEIDKNAKKLGLITQCYIEINISSEKSKGGILPEQLNEFIDQIRSFSNIRVTGIMTIGEKTDDFSKKINIFTKMQHLFIDNSTKKLDNIDISVLSMGMSEDYLQAVQYGSNIVRLGRALFSN